MVNDTNDKKQALEDLRDLKSFIAEAHEVQDRLEAVARLLKEPETNSKVYPISKSIEINITYLQEIFGSSYDIHFREILITRANCRAVLVYIENMADQTIINEHIIEKLTAYCASNTAVNSLNILTQIKTELITAASISEKTAMDRVVSSILAGDTALFINGESAAFIIATKGYPIRSVGQPETEADLRGPRDGFTEDLSTNVTLIRRRFNNPNLTVAKHTVGARSNTEVAIVYLRGITNMKLVDEVAKRLKNIRIDSPEDLSIQGLLEDHPYSPFPTMITTERPDKFVAAIVKGKVGLIIDGTPFSLLAPAFLSDFLAAGDDYYDKWISASILRLLRYTAAFFALTVPAFYVAITSFHPAFIPTPLALTIATSREGVPFPAVLEALLMLTFLEVMQEASIRMPKTVGQSVSIVGGLVIGDAVVRAGLVSSPLVIITAFTAIATFSIASYQLVLPVRILRLPLMVAAATFGNYGVMLMIMVIATHLCILESFGEPYLASVIPKNAARLGDPKDSVIVAPPDLRRERPAYLEPLDSKRNSTE